MHAMNCKELADFLLEYCERALPAAQQQAFELHLERCPPCRAYLASYRQTIELGRACAGSDARAQPAARLPQRLVDAILAARKAQPPSDERGGEPPAPASRD